jgi:hypothetical protein
VKLLLLNPSESHYDRDLDIEPQVSRIIDLYKKTKDFYTGVVVLLERGGWLDHKMHRILLGEGRDLTVQS